jgi:branched-chain amino acid transport system ATP-binding protein
MLEVESLNTFYGRAHILRDVSLSIGDNEVVALLGRNGAGKSTTMKSIMGLVRPRQGSMRYDGEEFQGRSPHQICRLGLGYVPEERRIFSDLTVLENLEVGRRASRPNIPEWNFDKLFELFPNLAERRSNLGSQLSGGEQQMLTIARTLMGNPKLVLLDEPSEGIAPVIVEHMAKVIVSLKREGLAVLISEQNLYFAKLVSNRAYIVEKGEVKFQGTFDDLEAQPDVRQRYLAL